MSNEPSWIDRLALILLQAESLAEHGGLEGLRDENLLDSALARPHNLWAYQDAPDLAQLAAAYGVGLPAIILSLTATSVPPSFR